MPQVSCFVPLDLSLFSAGPSTRLVLLELESDGFFQTSAELRRRGL